VAHQSASPTHQVLIFQEVEKILDRRIIKDETMVAISSPLLFSLILATLVGTATALFPSTSVGPRAHSTQLFSELRLLIQGTKNAYTVVRPNDVILYQLAAPLPTDTKKTKALGVYDGQSIIPLYSRVEGDAEFFIDAVSEAAKMSATALQKGGQLLRVISSDRRGMDCFIIDEYLPEDVDVPVREEGQLSIVSNDKSVSTSPSIAIVEAQLEVAELKLRLLELKAQAITKNGEVRVVDCPVAPAAIGPYSQATVANGFLFVSGCLGIDVSTMSLMTEDGVIGETRQALSNLKRVICHSGSSLERVVKTTIYLADMDDFAAVNRVYGEYFSGPTLPARVCVAVKTLPRNAKVEIDAIALCS